jgi:MoaA/NifB/PqqE/SkfB family radical SAM enzyme
MIKPKYQYEIIESIEQIEREYEMQVSLRITEKCNIACEYCLWRNGTVYEDNDLHTIIDKLYEFFVINEKSSVLIYFHGGEPTTHSELINVLDHIREKEKETGIDTYIEFQTNLVVGKKRFLDILDRIDGLNISLHLKELMKSKTLYSFERNWQYLVDTNYRILNLDIMLEYGIDNMYRYLRKVLKFLKYENIQISEMVYAYIDFEENDDRYNTRIRKQEYELYEKLYAKYNRNVQLYKIDGKIYETNDLFLEKLGCEGMACQAGYTHLVVNGDGNVFVCNTNMTNYLNDRNGEVYTNLIHDDKALMKLKLLQMIGYTKCRWEECSSDFYFGKRHLT